MADQMIDPSYYLPTELVIDIFLRLPVKTLIRCTSVCKSWYALIRNPNFVTSHFNSNTNYHQQHHDDGYILLGGTNFCHVVSDKTFEFLYAIQTPFTVTPNNRKSSLNFVGSCNGLLCLAPGSEYNLGDDVYIWNPSIQTHKKLPPSQFSDEFTNARWIISRLGFGFHELTNDYKIIRILYFPESRYFTSVDVAPLVEIYSLKTNSWKIVHAEVPRIVTQSAVTFQKGVFYWMGFKRHDPTENHIISFDLDDEKFREIEQPSVDFPFSLLAVRGSSGSLFAVYSEFYGGKNDSLVLWKMDEYSRGWTKAYMIQCDKGVWCTLGFTKSGKFLYANLEKFLVSVDLESLQIEVHDLGISFSRSAVGVNYMESLLLFDH